MNPILYLLMRIDLVSLNPGKAMAQACHVGNMFDHEIGQVDLAREPFERLGDLYDQWRRSTEQGFGTTICLATTKDQLIARCTPTLDDDTYIRGVMIDPSYPVTIPSDLYDVVKRTTVPGVEVHPSTDGKTCTVTRREQIAGFVFGDKYDQKVMDLVNGLRLHH